MNESQALDHLTQQLDTALGVDRFAVSAGLEVLEVLDLLGKDGRRRVLASAYLHQSEDDTYWPTYSAPAEVLSIVRHVLTTAEPRAVSTCPPWCDEHATAHRHSVFEDDREGTGYTVGHHAAHGRYVSVEASETALTTTGPTLLDRPGVFITLSLEAGEPLTADDARQLARDLFAAVQQIDETNTPPSSTTTTDTEENQR